MAFEFAPWERYDASVQDGPPDGEVRAPLASVPHKWAFKCTSRATFFRLANLNGPFHNFALLHDGLWDSHTHSSVITPDFFRRASRESGGISWLCERAFRLFLLSFKPHQPALAIRLLREKNWLLDTRAALFEGGEARPLLFQLEGFRAPMRFKNPKISSQIFFNLLELASQKRSSELGEAAEFRVLSLEAANLRRYQSRTLDVALFQEMLRAFLRAIFSLWQGADAASLGFSRLEGSRLLKAPELIHRHLPDDQIEAVFLPPLLAEWLQKLTGISQIERRSARSGDPYWLAVWCEQRLDWPNELPIRVSAPSFHERLEAMAFLRENLRRIWPEGAAILDELE